MDIILEIIRKEPSLGKRFQVLIDIFCVYMLDRKSLDKYKRMSRIYYPTEHIRITPCNPKSTSPNDQYVVAYKRSKLSPRRFLFVFCGNIKSSCKVDFMNIKALEILPLYEDEVLLLSDQMKINTLESQTKKVDKEQRQQDYLEGLIEVLR